ncbi:MAG: class I SAM-dependent methyltransferase [Candidatus Fermentibacteraceae bacterium]|nr:class I SAM-dependent methyltransferase [Candidatus Fermentibacteraceae bacterium]
MKYYESHEECYKEVKKSNTSSWDEFQNKADAFEDFYMKEFLTVALDRINPASNSRILDVGCGTGPAACFFAKQGYLVDGIDVSRTAIEMAQTNAKERGLNIHFSVDDICRISETGSGIYDVISDTHCMHCITYDADRKAALSSIFRLLKNGGHFIMETMSIEDTSRWSDSGRMDELGILWNEVKEDYPYDKVFFEDKFWMCTRRVLSPSALQKELEQTGFLIEHLGTTQDIDIEYMADFQAICSKPSA